MRKVLRHHKWTSLKSTPLSLKNHDVLGNSTVRLSGCHVSDRNIVCAQTLTMRFPSLVRTLKFWKLYRLCWLTIRKDLVGLGDLLELFRGLVLVLGVLVRVPLERQASISVEVKSQMLYMTKTINSFRYNNQSTLWRASKHGEVFNVFRMIRTWKIHGKTSILSNESWPYKWDESINFSNIPYSVQANIYLTSEIPLHLRTLQAGCTLLVIWSWS